MKKFFLIYFNISIIPFESNKNINIINTYFEKDGNRKTNDLNTLKYYFIVPIVAYIGLAFLFSIVYYIITKKIIFTFWFLDTYFNYKISKHNGKYLY
jgi:hypothetical protein